MSLSRVRTADTRPPLATVLAATTISVYALIIIGLYRERTRSTAFRAFHASNVYLGSLLVVITVDTAVL